MTVARNIALFGTDEPSAEGERFQIGDLTFTLESGGVRHVRFAGREVMRGIQYLVRDGRWSTPAMSLAPSITGQSADGLAIRFDGRVCSGDIDFVVTAEITASSEGRLSFKAKGKAEGMFDANRIGFTLLHPTPACAGIPLTVEHLDGSLEETRFPLEIGPSQPVFDICTLSYRIEGSVDIECRMLSTRPGGRSEPFEMEDQRNWSDASFKTYVGTLLEPLPYRVEKGDVFEQEIVLRCQRSQPDTNTATGESQRPRLRLGEPAGTPLPPIGVSVPHGCVDAALNRRDDLAKAKPQHLTGYLRPDDGDLERSLSGLEELATFVGAPVHLEIELPCASEPTAELGQVSAACARSGLRPVSVLASPTAYLRSYQPNGEWPDVPPLENIYAAARECFPEAEIGGGMLSYFTELNRKWPPRGSIDFVSHTVTPIVHAGDDLTLMENLTTLPSMAATVKAQLGEIEHHLGPSAISMRHNPYGGSTVANIDNLRMAMADADPRERGLFAAAWTVGLVAQACQSALGALTLFATSGPRSILHQRDERHHPWYDDVQGAKVRPVFHVIASLGRQAGGQFRPIDMEPHGTPALAAFAVETDESTIIWLANLGAETLSLDLGGGTAVGMLDAASFEAACIDPDWSFIGAESRVDTVELDAYAVARCRPT